MSNLSQESFADLGGRIESLNSRLTEIKTAMKEQDIGVADILNMSKNLNEATEKSAESSNLMKIASGEIMAHIEALQSHAKSIRGNAEEAFDKIEKMKDFSATTKSRSAENLNISNKINAFMGEYKTE